MHQPERLPRAKQVRLSLLGRFALRVADQPIAVPAAAQRLLAFLALHDHPLRRVYVAGTFWIEGTDGHAQASLRSTLWRLRHCGPPIVEATREELRLHPAVRVDIHEQVALARRLLDPAELEEVEWSLLEGELLPDWYEDWVLLERERLRQLRLHALEALAEKLAARGRYGEAVEAGHTALRCDVLRESTQRVLIRIYLAEGNRREAMRQYELYRDLLRRKLGLEPSPEVTELVRELPVSPAHN